MQDLDLKSKPIKCFALDVDGTIADNEGHLDLEAASIIKSLAQLGYQIIFVSGRSAWELIILASYLGTSNLSVGENGGILATSPLDIQVIGDKSKTVTAYDYLSKKIKGVEIKPTMPRFTEVVLKRSFDIEKGRKLLSKNNMSVNLIDSTFAYHITDKTVNKGEGLKLALEKLKIDPSETIAIGDSDTDIPMFKICKYSIASGKPTNGAKENATYIVKSNPGEGLVDAFQLSFQKILNPNLEEVLKK
jgi:phosphoglycolate phosphatase (TIGR01487 family)